jgi:SPP1 family predicted phage head-tail adaptor
MNDILKLISQARGVDEYGDPVLQESAREVFCGVRSIGGKEFYQAQAVGLQPEVKFVLADYLEYSRETLVEHDGQRYRVLRTYRKGKELELTCYQEVNPA